MSFNSGLSIRYGTMVAISVDKLKVYRMRQSIFKYQLIGVRDQASPAGALSLLQCHNARRLKSFMHSRNVHRCYLSLQICKCPIGL